MPIKCGHFRILDSCKCCLGVQRKWYRKLKGFEDIEDPKLRLIKKWTGVSYDIIDQIQSQEPNSPIESNWPMPNFSREEDFLNHPDFENICKNLFKHKNNVISHAVVINIWRSHCDGLSYRQIGIKEEIPYVTVFRGIRKLKELMKIMDLDQNIVAIIRAFDPVGDAGFIYSTWRDNVWFDTNKEDMDPIFFRVMTREIKKSLSDKETTVKIACNKNSPDQIIGYSVINNNSIEFVYIKFDYRKEGIATLLTKGFTNIYKPSTKIGTAIAKSHGLKIKGEQEDGKEEDSRETSRPCIG